VSNEWANKLLGDDHCDRRRPGSDIAATGLVAGEVGCPFADVCRVMDDCEGLLRHDAIEAGHCRIGGGLVADGKEELNADRTLWLGSLVRRVGVVEAKGVNKWRCPDDFKEWLRTRSEDR